MLIRKIQQPSDYPENSIHDAYSESNTDTYSCNYINSLNNIEDITSQCTFLNCSISSGKILLDKNNKMLYFQIGIKATATNSWTRLIILPSDIKIIPTNETDQSMPIYIQPGSNAFWLYTRNNETYLSGAITNNQIYNLVSFAFLQ